MRVCSVVLVVAALAPLAVGAPSPSRSDSPTALPGDPAVFSPNSPSLSITESTIPGEASEGSRSLAFWTTLDLDMLAVRDRVESSPLLRDGLTQRFDTTGVDFDAPALAMN